ncbi:MAG: hypothetical protein ACYSWX_15960 [Planctomycetota bacterium]|jgi:hypothetical protein
MDVRRVALIVTCALGLGCATGPTQAENLGTTSDGDDGDGAAPALGLATDAVAYELTWGWAGAERTDLGWRTTNDLGWTVEVHDGWLVDYAVSLIPCTGALQIDPDVLQPRGAAGHGGFTDPSAYDDPRIESLVSLEGIRYDALPVYAIPYCDAHWLVARADDSITDESVIGHSLHVRGIVTAPDETSSMEFDITSTWADGAVLDLEVHGVEVPTASIVIQRDLGSLFDGVDFEGDDVEAQGQRLLENLTDHATVRVQTELSEP